MRCFNEAFAMLQRPFFHAWGVTLRANVTLVYINYMEKNFFYFEKKKNYTIGLRNKCHTQR